MSADENLQMILAQLRESFDATVAEPIETDDRVYRQYIDIGLGGEIYAWPANYIREILIHQKVIPIPGKVDALGGVVNYRNQVISIIDLHHLLGLGPAELSERNTLLVTRGLKTDFAVLVDGLEAVLSRTNDDIRPKPVSLDEGGKKIVEGEFYHQGTMTTIINPEMIIG